MDYIDTDIPKYRKKSIKNVPTKSKHKHEYKFVVFYVHDKDMFNKPIAYNTIGTCCTICGKIGDIVSHDPSYVEPFDKWVSNSGLIGKKWNDKAKKEFNPETRTLPFFEIKDQWKQKFVEI